MKLTIFYTLLDFCACCLMYTLMADRVMPRQLCHSCNGLRFTPRMSQSILSIPFKKPERISGASLTRPCSFSYMSWKPMNRWWHSCSSFSSMLPSSAMSRASVAAALSAAAAAPSAASARASAASAPRGAYGACRYAIFRLTVRKVHFLQTHRT